MKTNKDTIREHLEYHLLSTHQEGNVSLWNLMGYCIGYYGSIDMDVMEAIMELYKEGWVHD